jgi:hypothetical protein
LKRDVLLPNPTSFGFYHLRSQETAAELEAESAEAAAEELDEAGGEAGQPLSARDILTRAVSKMGAGIALCAVFSDPLVEALTNLSRCGTGHAAAAAEAGAAVAAAQHVQA